MKRYYHWLGRDSRQAAIDAAAEKQRGIDAAREARANARFDHDTIETAVFSMDIPNE